MSLKGQLKSLSTPISTAFSTDAVRRKSLVYENPQSVDAQTCYRDCLKGFNRLCEVDAELKRFNETLFSAGSIRLQMCNLHSAYKLKIDEQISLFIFLINTHVRSSEAIWAFEWLVYKYEVHLHYLDEFMMLLIPHYESGLFAKCIQLLDFKNTSSNWHWLQPFAERGSPLTRQDFLKACRSQPALIPFIGMCMCTYAKHENSLHLNRIQTFASFFVSTISGLCDLGLSEDKTVKIVKALQGTIKKGLCTSEVPSFQSAACLIIVRFALSLNLNHELVLDWIGCLLKKHKNGTEWEILRVINVLMRTQCIAVLPDDLSVLYENLLNFLTPLERALLEKEEKKNYEGTDLNEVASGSLEQSERVQKATLIIDVDTCDQSSPWVPPPPAMAGTESLRKLTIKRILRMTYDDLFGSNPEFCALFETVRSKLGNIGVCLVNHSDGECLCLKAPVIKTDDCWLADFLIGVVLQFTQSVSIEEEAESDAMTVAFKQRQCEVALQIVVRAVDAAQALKLPTRHSPRTCNASLPNSKHCQLLDSLDKAFPCVLAALLHPTGDVRVGAYDLLQRFIVIFGKLPPTMYYPNVGGFLSDLQCDESIVPESVRQLLQGDTLSALVHISSNLVKSVFRLFCRQSMKDTAFSQVCWYSVAQLLDNELLRSIVGLVGPSTSENNDVDSLIGWPALLQIVRRPQFTRFEVVHSACIDKFDAFTLQSLAALSVPARGRSELIGISSHEAEFLGALIDLAGSQTVSQSASNLLSRLQLKVEHYIFCLARLDPIHTHNSRQSLFLRVSNSRRSINGEELLASAEWRRLRALKIILAALAGDVHRLHAASSTNLQDRQNGCQLITPLSSAVSRLKIKAKRRVSLVDQGKLNSPGDSLKQNDTESEEKNKDLVFPLNSHLLACISAETRFQHEAVVKNRLGGRQRTISTNSSIFLSESSDEDEGVQDVDMKVSPLSHDELDSEKKEMNVVGERPAVVEAASIREHTSACAFEVLVALTNLFAEGNKLGKCEKSRLFQTSLMPTPSITAAMDTIFQCLSVFKEMPSIQRQVMLCLIEMASLFPVILCKNLVTLVQWAGGSVNGHHSMFLKLDDVHNLSLLGRLTSVAVPALVQASKQRVDAGLRVLDVFVRGLPDLPAHLPRRSLALYVGLLRGLAQVVTPTPDSASSHTAGVGRRVTKQVALQSWLWTAAAFFLNTNWPSQETADLVPPLLIDLFNQFDLSVQLSSWQQCLEFFHDLLSNSDGMKKQNMPFPNTKRTRPETSWTTPSSDHPASSSPSDYGFLLKHLSCSDPDGGATPTHSPFSRKRPLVEKMSSTSGIRLWSLLSSLSAFFSGLLDSAGHHLRQKEAIDRGSETVVQETFGNVVELTVQLLLACSSSQSEPLDAEDSITQKSAIQNLQSVLIKMNGLMSNQVFLDSVARLMSSHRSNLTRKALELLLAKLESLTVKCPCATALLTLKPDTPSPLPRLEASLEKGLIAIFDKLSSSIVNASSFFSADKGQAKLNHLRLSCLRRLAQLLCSRHPDKLLKTLDVLVLGAVSCWWPSLNATVVNAMRVATYAAEARSMACLFIFECLTRLPLSFMSICATSASVTTRIRMRHVLRFALDHAVTACRLSEKPVGATTALSSDKFHSREQHLQAGVALLLGAFELSTRMPPNFQASLRTDSVLESLREEETSTSQHSENNTPVPTERLDLSLLSFVFRTTHLDLLAATQAKADRSTATLKQCTAIIRRLRSRFISLPESLNLLKLTYELLKDEVPEANPHLISGGLEFVSSHADYAFSVAATSDVDMESSRPNEGLPNSLETAYASEPLLIWRLLRFALDCRPTVAITATVAAPSTTSSPVTEDASVVSEAACLAGASLLAAMNADHRLQLVGKCLQWLVEGKPDICVVMARLQSLFAVLERLSTKVSAQCFVSLVKNANLVNLFVCCLSLLAGDSKSKNVRKLASPLELSQLLDCFSSGMAGLNATAGACARSALAATAAWLRAESQLSACLDTAGTDSVLALPQAFIKPLGVAALGLTEVDFVPCVAAFLSAIGGDEALLRPFGTCLCDLVTRSADWRMRLAGLRLLKQTFDTLMEGRGEEARVGLSGDLGLATCLVPDTLVALSEALEDDRNEVEAAANRLFADLEAIGATAQNNE
ncbi:HEAT repeat-containing protein 1 [Echinococcus granulosus]|nr:HEAT repeat-containing protein 1 [Echinococcus granulosus]